MNSFAPISHRLFAAAAAAARREDTRQSRRPEHRAANLAPAPVERTVAMPVPAPWMSPAAGPSWMPPVRAGH